MIIINHLSFQYRDYGISNGKIILLWYAKYMVYLPHMWHSYPKTIFAIITLALLPNCSWVIPELAVSMILQLSWLGWLVSTKIKHHQRTPKVVTQQIIWETHYLACLFHLHYLYKVRQTVTVMLVQESLWNNLDLK